MRNAYLKKIIFKNFRIVDTHSDFYGSIIVEDGLIKEIVADVRNSADGAMTIDSRAFDAPVVLMPAFIDLHAHFRDPGSFEKDAPLPSEVLESASLAAVAGGYTTVVCMANTNPVIDTIEKVRNLKTRSDALGLVDLYPVLSLTKNMEGRELSEINDASIKDLSAAGVLMLSEDGKDVADDDLFLAAMKKAKQLGIPISCHCDLGGENDAVRRAIELGKKAGCHIHIAHVSTKEAAEIIREAKKDISAANGFSLTCEATPHHIGATEADARRMGEKSFGRVNPPLRTEADRLAIIAAIYDKTIDAIATDHAPHRTADKAAGTPGFSGLETAFAISLSNLMDNTVHKIGLQRLSALMSANPAQILGLQDRGRIAAGLRADMVIASYMTPWTIDPNNFKSRGKCTPFAGMKLREKILMTLNAGRIVYGGDGIV